MSIEEFIEDLENNAKKYEQKELSKIDNIFKKYIELIVAIYSVKSLSILFDKYELSKDLIISKQFRQLTQEMSSEILKSINNATKQHWINTTHTINELVYDVIDIEKAGVKYQDLLRTNSLESYFEFKKNRMNDYRLSRRVWKYTRQFEEQMKEAFEIAINEGNSAQKFSRDIKKYLNNPESLYRRVIDNKGRLTLSKTAKLYNPGTGVYRSASKNAQRLARTEINAFYKGAENNRWQELDFVVGFEIRRSNNVYDCDVCESLKGFYPKTFRFTNWHPNCRCYQIPILKPVEQLNNNLKEAVNEGYTELGNFKKEITKMPKNYTKYIKNNYKFKHYNLIA